MELYDLYNLYRDKLLNYTFTFETSKGTFKCFFDTNNFKHLLGIHHVYGYKDKKAWEISNGISNKTITFDVLKKIDSKNYKQYVVEKARHFSDLILFLDTGDIDCYHTHGKFPITSRLNPAYCTGGDTTYIPGEYVFLGYNCKPDGYFPATILVYKDDDKPAFMDDGPIEIYSIKKARFL